MLPKPLLDDIACGSCLPFVGAGFSLNADLPKNKRMPDWDMLGQELANDLRMKSNKPIDIASRYEERFGRAALVKSVREILNIDEVRPGEVHRKFIALPFDVVYTTNYDSLLEDSFKLLGSSNPERNVRPFRVLVGDKGLSQYGGPDVTHIIKMHGDFLNLEHLVITQKDYDTYLKNNPGISTHLQAMLMTKTPFFLGYSLSDPHLNQVRKIIRCILKNYTRKSYILSFDLSDAEIDDYDKNDLIAINLSTKTKSRTQLILETLQEVLDYVSIKSARKVIEVSGINLDEKKIETAIRNRKSGPLLETTADTCFVSTRISTESQSIFRMSIRSAIEKFGLLPKRSNQLSMGLPVLEEIKNSILQCKLFICDVTSRPDFVLYELGIATENNKNIIVLSQSKSDLTDNLKENPYIIYTPDDTGLADLRNKLEQAIEALLFKRVPLSARKLIEQKYFDLAVITMTSYIDTLLNNIIRRIKDVPDKINSFKYALEYLHQSKIISDVEFRVVHDSIKTRNNIVHYGNKSSKKDSEFIVQELMKIGHFLYSNLNTIVDWHKYFYPEEREELVNSFLITLDRLESEFSNRDRGDIFLPASEVFLEMKRARSGQVLVPIIVKTAENQGLVTSRNNLEFNNLEVQLSTKGREKMKK